MKIKHHIFKNSFFLSNDIEWNLNGVENLIFEITIVFTLLKRKYFSIISPALNSCFNSYDPQGCYQTVQWPQPLRQQNFRHNFQDSLNLFCKCEADVKSCLF